MELTYRGVVYEPSDNAVDAAETNQTGIFLGQRYTMRQHSLAQRQSSSRSLTYRGVSYTR